MPSTHHRTSARHKMAAAKQAKVVEIPLDKLDIQGRDKPAQSIIRPKVAPLRSKSSSPAPSALVSQRRDNRKVDVESVVFDLGIAARAKNVVEFMGNQTQVADLLGVHRGQPGRWLAGKEQPSAENARLVVDIDHVVARASLIWPRSVALEWLEGANSYLDGARPIDVLKTRGSSEVIDALDSAMAGNFS